MSEYKEDGYKEDDYYPVIRKERKQPTMVQHKKGDVECDRRREHGNLCIDEFKLHQRRRCKSSLQKF